MEEKEKLFKEVESDVAALSRRIMLMEEEAKKSETSLADTVTKLAIRSKDADNILKGVKVVESKCLNNEATLEELDKNLRSTAKMASDNEQKLDELSRKLGVQEGELKRGIERAELAENNLKVNYIILYILYCRYISGYKCRLRFRKWKRSWRVLART